jgi:hypothetical protein
MQTQPHPELARWKVQYAHLRSRLAQTGWISEGSDSTISGILRCTGIRGHEPEHQA